MICVLFLWVEKGELTFLGSPKSMEAFAHLSKECKIGYSSEGDVSYDLIIAVVEANQEVTWHEGETPENCRNVMVKLFCFTCKEEPNSKNFTMRNCSCFQLIYMLSG